MYTGDATDNILRLNAGSGNYTGCGLEVQIARTSNEHLYEIFKCISSHDSGADTRFSVRGDGLTTVDGILNVKTGVTFASDTATAKQLDEYEEGTWTPLFGGATTNPTGSNQGSYAYYTKIGKMVHVMWYVYFTISNVGAGALQITGLPFNSSTSSGEEGFGVHVNHFRPYIPHGQHPRIYSADKIGFLGSTSAGSSWAWATTSLLSTSDVALSHGSLTYFVA
jgi:hypothetical protein